MRRLLLGGLAVCLWSHRLLAQAVPARDLWEFPLGALFEPPALASEPGAGLWNPASARLQPGERLRVGVASLAAGAAQGIDGQLLSAAWRRASGTTLAFSMARAAIGGLVRTESDPQTVGEIPYHTSLLSLVGARELLPHLSAGVAMRLRSGRADQSARDAVAADFGMILHDLPWRSARVALSSFLWRPGQEISDRPAVLMAGDLRVWGTTAVRESRVGYSHNGVNRGAREQGPFGSLRYDRVEGRLSYLRTAAGARSISRLRSGLALHYAAFVVGLAREEGASGLGPVYQFTLSSLLK